jgi:ribosome-associated toxin RatA of RatAB toxin-antitoxin module
MADATTSSITIDADPETVMAVIADFEAYPEWADQVKTVEILEKGAGSGSARADRVRFSMDAGPIKDTYTLDYDWAPDGRSVSWTLVKGQMQKAQNGSYTLESAGGAPTTVTYSLAVDLNIPMIGMLRRKAEKVIIDTALKGLKRRVESRS